LHPTSERSAASVFSLTSILAEHAPKVAALIEDSNTSSNQTAHDAANFAQPRSIPTGDIIDTDVHLLATMNRPGRTARPNFIWSFSLDTPPPMATHHDVPPELGRRRNQEDADVEDLRGTRGDSGNAGSGGPW
jgi:hypothetical protein